MPATYEPIASQTLTTTTATVTFSDIPGTFTDLVLIAYVRSSHNATLDYHPNTRVNGDTGGNYSFTRLIGSSVGATSTRASNSTYMAPGDELPAANAASNVFSVVTMQFLSYANTNTFKTMLGTSGAGDATNVVRSVSLWRSTSAITSISMAPFSGSFVSGCTFSLYGIKAA